MEACEKCQKHPIEYDSPGNWCRYCWVEWWVDGMEIADDKERQEYYDECLRDIQQKFGDCPN